MACAEPDMRADATGVPISAAARTIRIAFRTAETQRWRTAEGFAKLLSTDKHRMRIKQIAALAPTLLGLGIPGGTAANPQVLLRPDVVARGHASSIEVTGIRSQTLQVRLVGASANSGQPIPWTPLHLAHGIWHAKLEMPELRGIYPVELRV